MVYCNPPYGDNIGTWARMMSKHKNGIMLIFARLETKAWQDDIFTTADGFLFPKSRISFCRPDGTQGSSAGAPSALVAWGMNARHTLVKMVDDGSIPGAFIERAFCTGQGKVIAY